MKENSDSVYGRSEAARRTAFSCKESGEENPAKKLKIYITSCKGRIKSEEKEILLKEDTHSEGKGFTIDENIDKIKHITKILQETSENVRKRIRWICEE